MEITNFSQLCHPGNQFSQHNIEKGYYFQATFPLFGLIYPLGYFNWLQEYLFHINKIILCRQSQEYTYSYQEYINISPLLNYCQVLFYFYLLVTKCFSKGLNVDTFIATYLHTLEDWFIKAIELDKPNAPMLIELGFQAYFTN